MDEVGSVGSRSDFYDNALAETVNGLVKTELIGRQGPWRTAEQVGVGDCGLRVEWWNQRRLHSASGYVPPAEYEAMYCRGQGAANAAA